MLDVDDTIIEVHGHAKQGAGFGYSGSAGSTRCSPRSRPRTRAPVIVAQRLRKGAAGSPRGAKRLVGDAVKTTRRLLGKTQLVLVRMDSAFYGRGPVHAALAGGAAVSVTVRMDKAVKKAIATIADDAWTTIEYTDAVFDEATGRWISRAEVAEIALHRVRRAEEGRPGPGPAGGAPDPGLQRREEQGRRPGHPVRRVAVPRVLHHRRPRSSTPSPRTRPTAITRSSSRSTPT